MKKEDYVVMARMLANRDVIKRILLEDDETYESMVDVVFTMIFEALTRKPSVRFVTCEWSHLLSFVALRKTRTNLCQKRHDLHVSTQLMNWHLLLKA